MSDLMVEKTQPPEPMRVSRRDVRALLDRGFSGPAAFGLLVLAAALGALITGSFSLTLATARLAGVLLLGVLLVNATSGLLKWLIGRRRSGRPRLVVRPIQVILLIVIALYTQWIGAGAVVIVGLLLTVQHPFETAVASETADHDGDPSTLRDRRLGGLAVLLGSGWALLLGIGAALGCIFLAGHPLYDLVRWNEIDASRAPELETAMDLAAVIGLELGMAVLVITIGSLPVLLLPLRGFEGRLLWDWSPIVWAMGYLVTAVAACILILPLVRAASVWLWCIPFALYAIGILALAWLRRSSAPAAPAGLPT